MGELQDRQVAPEPDQEFVAGRRPDRCEAMLIRGTFMDRIERLIQLRGGRDVSNSPLSVIVHRPRRRSRFVNDTRVPITATCGLSSGLRMLAWRATSFPGCFARSAS